MGSPTERIEERGGGLRVEPRSGIGDRRAEAPAGGVVGADDDGPPLRREPDGVADQVPEDLLQPDRVGVEMMAGRIELDDDLPSAAAARLVADLYHVAEHGVGVDLLPV